MVGVGHLEREWTVHKFAWDVSMLNGLFHVPKPLELANDKSWFVQEYLAGVKSVWSMLQQSPFDASFLSGKVISVLSSLHQGVNGVGEMPSALPEMPNYGQMDMSTYLSLPVWGRAYLGVNQGILQSLEKEHGQLDLRDGANADFIHGDLTADNVLLSPGGKAFLIDWERGGAGEREHDLAAFYGSVLAATYYVMAERVGRKVLTPQTVSLWIDEWQMLVCEMPQHYRLEVDFKRFRVYLAMKIIARAYSRAIVDGPQNALSITLTKIAGALLTAPQTFSHMWDAEVIA